MYAGSSKVAVTSNTGAVFVDLSGNYVVGVSASGNALTVVSGSTPNPVVGGTISQGTGISVTGPNGNLTVANTGVTALAGGTGLGVSASTGAVTLSNTGVTALTGGTGLGVSASTGAVTLSNTGVTAITAGAGIGISGSTGNVTISSSIAGVISVSNGGNGSGIDIGGTGTNPTVSTNLTSTSNGGIHIVPSGSNSSISLGFDPSLYTPPTIFITCNGTNGGGAINSGAWPPSGASSGQYYFQFPSGVWILGMTAIFSVNNSNSCLGLQFNLQNGISIPITIYGGMTVPLSSGVAASYNQSTMFPVYFPTTTAAIVNVSPIYGTPYSDNPTPTVIIHGYRIGLNQGTPSNGAPFS